MDPSPQSTDRMQTASLLCTLSFERYKITCKTKSLINSKMNKYVQVILFESKIEKTYLVAHSALVRQFFLLVHYLHFFKLLEWNQLYFICGSKKYKPRTYPCCDTDLENLLHFDGQTWHVFEDLVSFYKPVILNKEKTFNWVNRFKIEYTQS